MVNTIGVKFLFHILVLLITLAFISGCDRNEYNAPVPAIDLLFPDNGEVVDSCGFMFKWESSGPVSDFQFILSENQELTQIIVDTVTGGSGYFKFSKPKPGKEYFWKVISAQLQAEAIDSFYTKDYVAYFQGTYPADVRIEKWDIVNGVTWDTMFIGSVVIEKITEEKVKVTELSTGKGRTFTYNAYLSEVNIISFLYDDVSRSSIFGFNCLEDTFSGSVTDGGLGSKTTYIFSGKKE
jgi:hypothetical protein